MDEELSMPSAWTVAEKYIILGTEIQNLSYLHLHRRKGKLIEFNKKLNAFNLTTDAGP
jgi:hypothetical protein